MPRFCQHTFVCIKPLVENRLDHAVIACLYCGQIRHVYEDGVIDIFKEEGVVQKPKKNENSGK